MSYIPFHKWGARNNDQTQNLINGTTYSGSITGRSILPGECLWYTHDGSTFSYSESPNYATGAQSCFHDETAHIMIATQNNTFARRWLTPRGANSEKVDEGTTSEELYATGISVNGADAADYVAVQSAGIAQAAWDDSLSNADLGVHLDAASTAGEVKKHANFEPSNGAFALLVNRANAGNNSGYVWAKCNFCETYSDIRLKENIELIGRSLSGINIYKFEYKNKSIGKGIYRGVMSHEVPVEAVIKTNTYNMVDYSKIDVDFMQLVED